jgi:hypothetical protein
MEKKVIGIELQTGDAVKAANNLDKSVTDLSASFEDVYGEMQPLSGRMGELEDRMYELALAGQSNTQEFKDLEKEVGKYKKTIMEVDLAVDAAAQTMGQKLGGSLEFASGGFTAIQGAAASFGVESAALEESILKVQSAMAITQGINSMREGFKSVSALASGFAGALGKTVIGQKLLTVAQYAGAVAMKVLNAVMNLNPVFLLITGITALVGAIAYFSSSTISAAEMNDKLNKSYEDTIAFTDKIAKNLKRNADQALKRAQLEGKSEKDLHDIRVKNLEDEEKVRERKQDIEKKLIDKKKNLYKLALALGLEEDAKTIKEEIKQSRERYDDLKGQHKDYINNKVNENLDYNNKKAAAEAQELADTKAKNKEAYENYKAYQQRRLSVQQEIEDLRLGLLADGEFKEIEILNTNAKRKRDALIADTSVKEEQKAELLRWYDTQRQADEQKIRDVYIEKEKEAARIAAEERAKAFKEPEGPDFSDMPDGGNVEIEAEILTQAELKQIRSIAREEEAAAHAAAMQDKIDKSAGYFDAVSQSLQALDDLNSLLTDKAVADAGANEAAAEAARKKGFERSKKIQITMAVIQGVQGVMSAFTAGSSMGPAGVVMGPLMAALAAVTAGVNIAKIKATKYEGGGGGGGASVPQSIPNPASFNVVGDAGTNQIAETLGQQNMNPQKAYVVSGDVTSAQSLERNKIENASL